MRTLLPALFLSLLLSGCLQPAGDAEPPPVASDPLAAPPAHEEDCMGVGVFFFPETAQVQRGLPQGIAAEPLPRTVERAFTDQGLLLGLSLPGDRTLVAIAAHRCHTGAGYGDGLGYIVIAVEPPNDPWGRRQADMDLYVPGFAVQDGAFRGALSDFGWTLLGDQVHGGTPTDAGTWAGSLEVLEAGSTQWLAQVHGAVGPGYTARGMLRLWHDNDGRTSSLDWLHFTDGQEGTAFMPASRVSCAFQPGSAIASILGVTSCDAARASGQAPVGVIQVRHDMDMDWRRAASGTQTTGTSSI